MNLALFDLDNTLLPLDSDYEWGQFLSRIGAVDLEAFAQRNARFLLQYQDGTLNPVEYLEFAFGTLARFPRQQLDLWHEKFMREVIQPSILPAARALARRIAERLNYVGVFAIEFFASDEGPVFNEMAPRVHNSGHWTIEGAVTSQFENHIRAVVGLPLGGTKLAAPGVEMRNLIGADADKWLEWASDPLTHLHLYGKHEARPGRKMGHITRLTGL